MGRFKNIHTPPTEEILAFHRGGKENHLKNVFNFYKMSGEGGIEDVWRGGIITSSKGGIDLFWNNPLQYKFNSSKSSSLVQKFL